MTESLEILYQNALLSDAAYLDWTQGENESDEDFITRMQGLLQDRGFTEEQARLFTERYIPIQQQPNTESGFAAT